MARAARPVPGLEKGERGMREELQLAPGGVSVLEHEPALCPIVSVNELAQLKAIDQNNVSLAIWERRVSATLRDWLTSLAPEDLPQGRLLVQSDKIELAVESLLEEVLRVTPVACMLAADITQLAQLFAEVACCDEVDIRLDVIQHDACRKFHLDNVAMRMVTTYLGESTQYVLPEFGDEALSAQQAFTGPLEQMTGEAVAIFKGSRAADRAGIVHRSPPIKGKNQTRLFICINARSLASPSPW